MASEDSLKSKVAFSACAAVAAFGLLLFFVSDYYPYYADDSYISLRYVERFLAGDGLTWNEGAPVEGYSNLLWMMLIALFGAFGAELVLTSRVLGLLCVLGVLYFVARRADGAEHDWRGKALVAALPLMFTAAAAPTVLWSIAGLEQPLVMLLLAGAIHFVLRYDVDPEDHGSLIHSSICLGLLCLTRPDGPLLCVPFWLFAVYVGRGRGLVNAARTATWLALAPVVCVAGQLIFRLSYYGDWVPNTARVKIAFTSQRLEGGWDYLRDGVASLFPIFHLAVAGIFVLARRPEGRARLLLLTSLLVLWSGYLVFIGGDVFKVFRHFCPLIVVLAFLLVELGHWATELARISQPVALAFTALCFTAFAWNQAQLGYEQEVDKDGWVEVCDDLSEVLQTTFGDARPLTAVTVAGCIPYFTGFPSVDMLGLNDRYIAEHPPEGFGEGYLGHELGDADYVLGREPELIIFHVGIAPLFVIGDQLQESLEFGDRYRRVGLRVTDDFSSMIYVDHTSETLGVRVVDGHMQIPGYFFAQPEVGQVFVREGKAISRLFPGRRVELEVRLEQPGSWSLDPEHPIEGVDIQTRSDEGRLYVVMRSVSGRSIEFDSVHLRRD